MRRDPAICIVVLMTLGLSTDAATIAVYGERGGPALLTWHDPIFG
jgi:hypothetical protein